MQNDVIRRERQDRDGEKHKPTTTSPEIPRTYIPDILYQVYYDKKLPDRCIDISDQHVVKVCL